MRIALVSDIHANLQAWNAVLLDVRALGADTIVCLGDIIGYGPDPSKVLASVHSNVDHILLGNHDAAICGKMDASLFNDSAREIIAWSASKLNNAAKKFLASLPLSVNCDYFRCAHGDFANPAAFNYIFEPADAMPSWQAVAENLLFSGHTHVPQIFVLGQSGIPRNVAPQDFVLEDEKRYIVTVGSVGQPRDNTTYASYCLYDTDKKTIFWRNIPFDIDAYRAEVENSGISMDASVFLKHDPRLSAIPVRQRVNFSPSATKETEAKDTVLVKELGTLQKTVKKWKVSFLLLSILFLLSLILATFIWHNNVNRQIRIPGHSMNAVDPMQKPVDINLLSMPQTIARESQPIPGWDITIGHRNRQSIRIIADGPSTAFVLSSTAKEYDMLISSAPVLVSPGLKFCAEASIKKADNFEGNIFLSISTTVTRNGKIETNDRFITKQPLLRKQDGWYCAKQTFEPPSGCTSIRVHVCGAFTGEAIIKDISLERKE